jgi:hypothetical protein
MNAVAVAVMIVAAVRLYLFFTPHPSRPDVRAHEELGRVLAAEALELCGGEGRIVMIGREISEFEVPVAEAQIRAFQAAIKKAGRPAPTFRRVKVDPLRTLAVPVAEFFEAIRQAKETDVIVSFLGPALLTAEQISKLGPKPPKVIAVCPDGLWARVDLHAVFEQKLLVTAVVSRPGAPANPTGDARHAFAQMFQVINQGNLADLPSLAAGREGRP